jgi:N-carbamoyl-L-amino-acid hydrolase
MHNLSIDGDRLWASLMEMARIGATEKGGVCRLALTDLDRQGRDLFRRWAEAAGATVRVDAIGNMFARRPGTDPDAAPVMTGSHLDTQPTGGKFDGVYGVLAGIEVLRTLADRGIETKAPVEVVVWTNEEGSRFPPATMGSGAFVGAFDLDEILARRDRDGISVGEALDAIGYRGAEPLARRPIKAYFEAHIEQGPILEAAGRTIGIVTGVQGINWYDVVVEGQEAHAGPTPMPLRRDALWSALPLLDRVYRLAEEAGPHGRATIGVIDAHPASRNTIPGRLSFTIDMRHPDADRLSAMDAGLREAVAALDAGGAVKARLEHVWHSPPTPFAPTLIDAVRQGAARRELPAQEIVSGAAHDAVYLARVAPTAMIFVPCEGGLSHNEEENATPRDLAAGCDVLLDAVLTAANA